MKRYKTLIKCSSPKEQLQTSDGLYEEEGLTIGAYDRKLSKMFTEENSKYGKN
jgi:hypothetical protein